MDQLTHKFITCLQLTRAHCVRVVTEAFEVTWPALVAQIAAVALIALTSACSLLVAATLQIIDIIFSHCFKLECLPLVIRVSGFLFLFFLLFAT